MSANLWKCKWLGISCGGTGCCGKTTFGIVTVDPGTDVEVTAVDNTFFLCVPETEERKTCLFDQKPV